MDFEEILEDIRKSKKHDERTKYLVVSPTIDEMLKREMTRRNGGREPSSGFQIGGLERIVLKMADPSKEFACPITEEALVSISEDLERNKRRKDLWRRT